MITHINMETLAQSTKFIISINYYETDSASSMHKSYVEYEVTDDKGDLFYRVKQTRSMLMGNFDDPVRQFEMAMLGLPKKGKGGKNIRAYNRNRLGFIKKFWRRKMFAKKVYFIA